MQFPIEVKRGSATVKIYSTPSRGQECYTLSYWRDGKRLRPRFTDLQKAKDEAGKIATSMDKPERRDPFLRAEEFLKPTGIPVDVAAGDFAEAYKILGGRLIVEAAREYAKKHSTNLPRKMVAELVVECVEAKTKAGLSAGYVRHLRYDLNKFAASFQTTIAEVSGNLIEQWLSSLDVAPRTRNNLRVSVQTLFSFAKAKKYLPKDHEEMDSVTIAKEACEDIEIFTPAEMDILLNNSLPQVVPFIALGGFAGIRHAEIQRLHWQDIRLEDGIIEIKAAKAKTASRRTVPLLDSCREWLLPHWKPVGPICTHRNMASEIADSIRAINKARKAEAEEKGTKFEPVKWKRNALRHSFISYRVAITKNVNQVALEAGNSPQIIFSNYRELVKPADAEKWFSILPPQAGKIAAMG